VLITADVGVVPARLMVDDLKTKVKVLGVRGPTEVRELLRTELLTQLGEDRTARCTPSRTAARPRWSSWSASTAPARPRPAASSPGS
jgi:fused signal recognition particle receptor